MHWKWYSNYHIVTIFMLMIIVFIRYKVLVQTWRNIWSRLQILGKIIQHPKWYDHYLKVIIFRYHWNWNHAIRNCLTLLQHELIWSVKLRRLSISITSPFHRCFVARRISVNQRNYQKGRYGLFSVSRQWRPSNFCGSLDIFWTQCQIFIFRI